MSRNRQQERTPSYMTVIESKKGGNHHVDDSGNERARKSRV